MNATVNIKEVYTIPNKGVILVGKVVQGSLQPGMKLNAAGKTMTIKSVAIDRKEVPEASIGENVNFLLEDGDAEILNQLKGKEATFSGYGNSQLAGISKAEPIHPKGFLDHIMNFFTNKKQ